MASSAIRKWVEFNRAAIVYEWHHVVRTLGMTREQRARSQRARAIVTGDKEFKNLLLGIDWHESELVQVEAVRHLLAPDIYSFAIAAFEAGVLEGMGTYPYSRTVVLKPGNEDWVWAHAGTLSVRSVQPQHYEPWTIVASSSLGHGVVTG